MATSLATARQLQIARSRIHLPKRAREVPRDQPPTAIEREYGARLAEVGQRMAAAARSGIPALLDWLRSERAALRIDAAPAPALLVDAMERAANLGQLEEMARKIGAATSVHQRRELTRQVQAMIGVDLSTNDSRIPKLIESFAGENAQLIKGIAAETSARMARIVAAGVATSKRPEQIAQDLEGVADLAPGRAQRIARDQVGKLYGQVAKQRQQDLGVEEYDWITVRDQRVRGNPGGKYPDADPSHWIRHGKRFRWDDPPEDGHPGEAVNCRCTARPVLAKLLALAGEEVAAFPTASPPPPPPAEEVAPRVFQVPATLPTEPFAVFVPAPPPEPTFVLPAKKAQAPKTEKKYHKEALAELARSARIWGKRNEDFHPSPDLKPGMTYSNKTFVAVREDYAARLDTQETTAALYYSHRGDQVLNNALRSGTFNKAHNAPVREMAAQLDAAINKFRMPEDTFVARGMSGDFATKFADALSVGDIFQEPGYTSTSATAPFDGDVQLRIKIPKGAPAGPIPSRYSNSEYEFLLGRGSKFLVLSSTRDEEGKRQIELELVL